MPDARHSLEALVDSAVLLTDPAGRDSRVPCFRVPRDPDFELFDRIPLTNNDTATTERVATAFADFFADRAGVIPQQSASEDFSDIPNALGAPYAYWCIGGIDTDAYQRAKEAGRVARDIPVNHSATFAPVLQPTLDTGTQAPVVAALPWLAR
jgi:metal-dependent amidase/aminoacylase/carboxypeptidase family protein